MKSFLISAFLVVSLTACSKSSAPGDAVLTSAPAASVAKAAAPAGPKVIALAKLGLKGTAPGETEEPMLGDGDPMMVMAANFTVTVAEAKATDPKKLKEAEDAAKLFNPKNVKKETLADGWTLTYENTGSAGANYFVNTRREIGGKGYLCDTMQNTPEQQKRALDFCKSLAK